MGMLKEAYGEQDSEGSKYGFGRREWLLDAHEGQKMAMTSDLLYRYPLQEQCY